MMPLLHFLTRGNSEQEYNHNGYNNANVVKQE